MALLIFVLGAYQNCGPGFQFQNLFSVNGTEIGNPGPISGAPIYGTNATLQIRSYTCALLARCRPTLDLTQCHTEFGATNGIASALGLPPDRYDPFSNLESAENRGAVVYDAEALDRCNQELINIPCTDPVIDSAYSADGATPIANTRVIYPQTEGSCPSVFRETAVGDPPATTN
jgi:hypothetical protein